jgi:predicted nucleic acid-binding Zn ribbon protein
MSFRRRTFRRRKGRAKRPERKAERRHVADVLSDLFGRKHMTEDVQVFWARRVWPDVCGKAASYSRPHSSKRGVLRVMVADSIWLQELSMQRHELVAALSRALPAEMAPKEIRFFVADPRDPSYLRGPARR